MSKRISLSDIAHRTGFDVSTVSRALRNLGTMPPATRQKIEAAAKAMGYRPNPLLASLASRRFGDRPIAGTPLAFLHFVHGTPSDQRIMEAMIKDGQEYAGRLGYQLNRFNVADFQDGGHASRVLFAQGIVGIVVPPYFDPTCLPGMDWERFSVVALGERTVESRSSPCLKFHRIAVDHFGLVLRAWEEVKTRGYKRIGFALFNIKYRPVEDRIRISAAKACLDQLPTRDRSPLFVSDPYALAETDTRKLCSWVRRHRLEVVIAYNAYFLWHLTQGGMKVPEEVGFVELYGSKGTGVGSKDTTGMKSLEVEPLRVALELLDQQVRHHERGLPPYPRTVTIQPEWNDGETLTYWN